MKRNDTIALTLFMVIVLAIFVGICLWKVCYRCVQAKAYDIQMHRKSLYGSDVENGSASKASKASSKVSEVSEAKKSASKKSEKKSEPKAQSKAASKPASDAWGAAPAPAPGLKTPSTAGWGGAASKAGGDGWGGAAEGAAPKAGW